MKSSGWGSEILCLQNNIDMGSENIDMEIEMSSKENQMNAEGCNGNLGCDVMWKVVIPLYSVLIKLHCGYCFQFWAVPCEKDGAALEHIQIRVAKLGKVWSTSHMGSSFWGCSI